MTTRVGELLLAHSGGGGGGTADDITSLQDEADDGRGTVIVGTGSGPRCSGDFAPGLKAHPRPGFSTEAVQTPARVNVTCVTPLGEEVASTS